MTAPEADPQRTPGRPGKGLIIAGVLLLAMECWLHTDAFLHRFRSVFAAGRAMDKVLYVEATRPEMLILGNSRADNGFDPVTVGRELGFDLGRGAFNLGLPGADARVLLGVVERLDQHGLLGSDGVRYLVLSLDESLVQSVDTLGQEVFFASPRRMWGDGQYEDLFRAVFRLYGYSSNLKQLREPASLQRFVQACIAEVDPVGGSAAAHRGYRAGFGGLQRADAAIRQEREAIAPPSAANIQNLYRLVDRLAARGVRVAVTFPPMLQRNVMYLSASPEAAPYRQLASELQRRGIPLLAPDDQPPRDPADFVNPGHLNDRGAQRYSRELGQGLSRLWRGRSMQSSDAS